MIVIWPFKQFKPPLITHGKPARKMEEEKMFLVPETEFIHEVKGITDNRFILVILQSLNPLIKVQTPSPTPPFPS